MPEHRQPTVSVIVITRSRPAYVADCLTHLQALLTPPTEVIVVDSSPDERTREVVETSFPEVRFLRNDLGPGTMPESRQIGFAAACGDIVAFIDDDANADPHWLDEIILPYDDPRVVAVGGRAMNGVPGEEAVGLGSIGRLLPNGDLTGNFAADPGKIVQIDHMLGANMSFRRQSLLEIGGIRGNYPGTCLREESDISLRLGARGGRIMYAPKAVVEHLAGPYSGSRKRFDRRYLYFARRNHVVLLARVFGFRSVFLRRYTGTTMRAQSTYARQMVRRILGRADDGAPRPDLISRVTAPALLTRSAAEIAGLVLGFPAAAAARRRDRRDGVGSP